MSILFGYWWSRARNYTAAHQGPSWILDLVLLLRLPGVSFRLSSGSAAAPAKRKLGRWAGPSRTHVVRQLAIAALSCRVVSEAGLSWWTSRLTCDCRVLVVRWHRAVGRWAPQVAFVASSDPTLRLGPSSSGTTVQLQ